MIADGQTPIKTFLAQELRAVQKEMDCGSDEGLMQILKGVYARGVADGAAEKVRVDYRKGTKRNV